MANSLMDAAISTECQRAGSQVRLTLKNVLCAGASKHSAASVAVAILTCDRSNGALRADVDGAAAAAVAGGSGGGDAGLQRRPAGAGVRQRARPGTGVQMTLSLYLTPPASSHTRCLNVCRPS